MTQPNPIAKEDWICIGPSEDPKSPKYKQPLYVAPQDAGIRTWDQAVDLAAKLRKEGKEVRLPTKIELNQIFTALAKKDIGGFDRGDSPSVGWYWAAEHSDDRAACQQFSGGAQGNGSRTNVSLVRFVR
jgi:hypothetical protein